MMLHDLEQEVVVKIATKKPKQPCCKAIQIVGVGKEDFGMVVPVGIGHFGIIPEEGKGTASASNIYIESIHI